MLYYELHLSLSNWCLLFLLNGLYLESLRSMNRVWVKRSICAFPLYACHPAVTEHSQELVPSKKSFIDLSVSHEVQVQTEVVLF